jgi:transcription antitermination protein NusB
MYIHEKAAPDTGCSPECPEQGEQCEFYVFSSSGDLSRRDSRVLIFHLLYALEASNYEISIDSIADNLARGLGFPIRIGDQTFTEAQAIMQSRDELDGIIKPLLDRWKFERLGLCTRIIIRMAIWELTHTATASTVIINEAIEISKAFAELDAYKFINGVLDEWVKRNAPADKQLPSSEA